MQGDLGYSRTYRVPVQELMGPRLWNTFLLSFISFGTFAFNSHSFGSDLGLETWQSL